MYFNENLQGKKLNKIKEVMKEDLEIEIVNNKLTIYSKIEEDFLTEQEIHILFKDIEKFMN